MRKQHEKILVATLAGLVICGAAAMVTQPVTARSGAAVSTSAPIPASVLALDRANA